MQEVCLLARFSFPLFNYKPIFMKKTFTTLFFTLIALVVSAADRTTAQMQEIARQKLAVVTNHRAASSAEMEIKRVLNKPTLSVFTNDQGFVIVSRDDRFDAVLAYGASKFDPNDMPEGLQWWIDAMQHHMENSLRLNNVSRRASYTPIAPLMQTKWGQGTPYKNYCPVFEKDKTKAPAGCVAIAMAQIINYHGYPQTAQFVGSYTIDGETKEVNVNSTYSFPYQIAYGTYLPDGATKAETMSYTPSKGNKVAMLCRDCGYAVNMNYNAGGSGAQTVDAAGALSSCFNYPTEAVKYYYRGFYTEDEWMDIIRKELEKSCPVIYAGASEQSGGHAFIFHGMDAEGLFYVNWGWQGADDGYYAFNALNPGKDDFNENQQLVTGIRPVAQEGDVVQSLFATGAPYAFDYDKETKDFSLTLNAAIYNYTCYDFVGRWAIVFENLSTGEKEYGDLIEENTKVESFYGFSAQTVTLGQLTFEPSDAGQYHIYMATLDNKETEWQPVRTIGGPIYYNFTVAEDGTATFDDTPIYTGIEEIKSVSFKNDVNTPARYFDLQGREVSGDTKGLLIRKQGNEVKKVMVK